MCLFRGGSGLRHLCNFTRRRVTDTHTLRQTERLARGLRGHVCTRRLACCRMGWRSTLLKPPKRLLGQEPIPVMGQLWRVCLLRCSPPQSLYIRACAAQDKDALALIDGVVRELRSRPRLLLDFERFVPRADRAWFRACIQCARSPPELALIGCSFV